jgi:hypothetical protein
MDNDSEAEAVIAILGDAPICPYCGKRSFNMVDLSKLILIRWVNQCCLECYESRPIGEMIEHAHNAMV